MQEVCLRNEKKVANSKSYGTSASNFSFNGVDVELRQNLWSNVRELKN